jgi:transcription elongation GreA/GreB family factor
MSRAFIKEDAEAFEELPDRNISPHLNHVTQQGLRHLEAMLNVAQETHAAAVAAQDRAAMAHAFRELRYWSARRASARVIPDPADTSQVRFGNSVTIRRRTKNNNWFGESLNPLSSGRKKHSD